MHEDRDKMVNDIIYNLLINLALICSGYLLHVYLRRQSTPAIKLGKSQVEMLGWRNNDLSKQQMRTTSRVAPVETRQFNKQYSRANVLDMNREGSSSYSEQATSWGQMARPMGTRLRERENFANQMKPDMEYQKRNLATSAEMTQRMETLIQEKTDATAMAKFLEKALESAKKRLEEICSKLIQAKKDNAILTQRNLKLEEKLEAFDSRLNFLVQKLRPDNRDEEMNEDLTNNVVVKKHTLDFVKVEHVAQEDLTSDDEQEEDIHNKGQEEMFLSAESEDEKVVSEDVITCKTEKSRENDEASDGDRIHKNVKYGDANSNEGSSCGSGSVVKDREIDDKVHWTGESDYVKEFEILGHKLHQEDEVDETVKVERNEKEEFHKVEHQKESKQSDDDEGSEVVEPGKHNEEKAYETAMTRETDEDNVNAVEAGESDESEDIIDEKVEREDEILFRGRSVETILEEEEEASSEDDSDVTIYSERSIYDQIDDIAMYFINSRPISGSPEFKRFLHNLHIQEKI